MVRFTGIKAPYVGKAYNNTLFFTPEGGIARRFINNTGGPSIKGYVVSPSSSVDFGVSYIVIGVPDPIGVIYEDDIPNGEYVWVVQMGVAQVYFQNNPTRKYLARGFVTGEAGYIAGQAYSELVPSSPFATDKHFYEIGHILESKGAPGLAYCDITHKN